MKIFETTFIIIFFSLYTACDRPNCKNTNPIFEQFSPESNEYKSELSNQIALIGFENLNFWFDKYLKSKDKEYIEIYVQNDSVCAKATLEVKDWSKIEGLRKENNGYRGAKLIGLKWKTGRVGNEVNFIYIDIDKIED